MRQVRGAKDKEVAILWDESAESGVLSALMRFGSDAYSDIFDIISGESFYDLNNQAIFKCMAKVLSSTQKVDIPSILSASKGLGLEEWVNTGEVVDYLKEIGHAPVELTSVRNLAAVIKRFQFGRELQNAARDVYSAVSKMTGSESLIQILSMAESPIQRVSMAYQGYESNRPVEINKEVREYIEHVAKNRTDTVGLSTPFPIYDDAIGGGLRRKCVDIIGARTGVGKSTVADCVALHNGKKGVPVLILDTEMGVHDHFNRMVANISGVGSRKVAQGQFIDKPEDERKVYDAIFAIESMPITFINISGRSTEEVMALARRWVVQTVGLDANGNTNDALMIYDYIQTTSSADIGQNQQEYQTLGFLTKAIHNFVVEHDISCMAFVQLNRTGISVDTLDAVSGSDRISQIGTSVSFFKEKGEEEVANDGKENGNRRISIAKARHGAGLPTDYINLQLHGDVSRIVEIGTRNSIGREKNGKRSEFETEREEREF
jgi:replicative DNA helicase